VTNVAAFAVIAMLGLATRPTTTFATTRACGISHPVLAGLMTVCLLSLGGLPPTAGFIGKWYIFTAAVSSGHYGLAIIGVLTSVVSVFFYLRVVVMMYMSDRAGVPAPAPVSTAGLALSLWRSSPSSISVSSRRRFWISRPARSRRSSRAPHAHAGPRSPDLFVGGAWREPSRAVPQVGCAAAGPSSHDAEPEHSRRPTAVRIAAREPAWR